MAIITLNVTLDADHETDDVLQLRVGSAAGLSLANSTPSGGQVLLEQVVGSLADADPAAIVELSASHRPAGGCGVFAVGATVRDAAGNVSPVFETFGEIADHPRGVTTLPLAATANPNEATLSWTASPDVLVV